MFFEIDKEAFDSMPIVLHTVGETIGDGVSRPEGLAYHEIIWVRRGSGIFNVEGEVFALEAGEGLFMRKGIPHEYHGTDFDTGWCTFSMPEETLDYFGAPRLIRFVVPGFLDAETDALHDFAVGESTVMTRSSAVYSYLTDFFSAVLLEKDSAAFKVSRLLESRYGEPLTLDMIAKEVDIDRYSLCRIFMKERGCSVMTELKRIRIAKAKRFLKYSSESIENIGYMCGFENHSYFTKRFREECGCTPSEYRKSL